MSYAPIVLVTGSTDGIGRETARLLVQQGARVVAHGRNADKAAEVARELEALAGRPMPAPVVADLASLAAVRAMADELLAREEPLDVLLNNAGVYMRSRELTVDGLETTMAVNHFAPFLLTHRLLPALRRAAAARIVNVSSIAHTRGRLDLDDLQLAHGFGHYEAYAASKLANVLFTVELAERLGPAITVNALHPGVVSTKLLTEGFRMQGYDSAAKASQTSVYCALSPELAKVTGQYFADRRVAPRNPVVGDAALRRGFYEKSCELTGVEPLPPPG
jgi:NAD(P)-dependent dehydrogenase (short-subunit alcohol dehydrogenase family)